MKNKRYRYCFLEFSFVFSFLLLKKRGGANYGEGDEYISAQDSQSYCVNFTHSESMIMFLQFSPCNHVVKNRRYLVCFNFSWMTIISFTIGERERQTDREMGDSQATLCSVTIGQI